MKNRNYIPFLALILLFSCQKNNSNNSGNATESQNQEEKNMRNNILHVDANTRYPQKDIQLEDIADVELIPIETTNDFLVDGRGKIITVTEKYIIFSNGREGSLLIYNRQGKSLHIINHKGQGGEEYSRISGAIFDETKEELYINDMIKKKIFIYDIKGNYKRSFPHLTERQYSSMSLFNDTTLICYDIKYDDNNEYDDKNFFILISNKDGRKIKEIEIPYAKRTTLTITEKTPEGSVSIGRPIFPILKYGQFFLLTDVASNSVYLLSQKGDISPFMTRSPAIESMNPPKFIIPNLITDKYFHMWNFLKEWNWNTNEGFPGFNLLYDRDERKIYEFAAMAFHDLNFTIQRDCFLEKNTYAATIEAPELIEKKAKLPAYLKELASNLEDDDNPVLMIIKF